MPNEICPMERKLPTTIEDLVSQFPNRYKNLYKKCKKHNITVEVACDSGNSWGMPPAAIIKFPDYSLETWGNPFSDSNNDILKFVITLCEKRKAEIKIQTLLNMLKD